MTDNPTTPSLDDDGFPVDMPAEIKRDVTQLAMLAQALDAKNFGTMVDGKLIPGWEDIGPSARTDYIHDARVFLMAMIKLGWIKTLGNEPDEVGVTQFEDELTPGPEPDTKPEGVYLLMVDNPDEHVPIDVVFAGYSMDPQAGEFAVWETVDEYDPTKLAGIGSAVLPAHQGIRVKLIQGE